jgi:hypothetical protein
LKIQNKKANANCADSFRSGMTSMKPKVHVRPMFTKHVLNMTVCRLRLDALNAAEEIKLFFRDLFMQTQCLFKIRANITMLITTMSTMGKIIPKPADKPLGQHLFFEKKFYSFISNYKAS